MVLHSKQKTKDIESKTKRPEAAISNRREENRRFLNPGEQQLSGTWMTYVGLLLRLVPSFCLVFGLYLFTDNAFGMQTDRVFVGIAIFLTMLLFSAMCWNRIVRILGILLLSGGGAAFFGYAAAHGVLPHTVLWTLLRSLYNSAISHMMTVGYGVLYVFKAESTLSAEEELLYGQLMFFLLQLLFSALCAGCSAKRVRVWPIAIVTAIDFTLVFLYNISTSKWGLAFAVSGICGLLCLWGGDRLTRKAAETSWDISASDSSNESGEEAAVVPKSKKGKICKGSAAVGYSAVFCTALALFAAALPASKVKDSWKTYDTIDTVMETIRSYEMALITGEDMQIADLGLTGAAEILNARSAIATPRSFTGKTVLEVQSNLTLPIYLRSWISSTYKDDLWHVADETTRNAFDRMFSDDFCAEDITYRFYRNLNPRLVRFNSRTSYANHEEDGFMTTLISLRNMGVAGNILFLPSRFDSARSLLAYGSLDEPYTKKWINYFDGIAYSRAFHKGARYSAVTNIPLYKDEGWMQSLNKKLAAYADIMTAYSDDLRYGGQNLYLELENQHANCIFHHDSLDRFMESYVALTEEEKHLFSQELSEVYQYHDYVMDGGCYTSLTEDESLNRKLRALALQIVFDAPLPDTGLTVVQEGEGDTESELDLTDVIAEELASLMVGDLVYNVIATDTGNLYPISRYGSADIDIPEEEEAVLFCAVNSVYMDGERVTDPNERFTLYMVQLVQNDTEIGWINDETNLAESVIGIESTIPAESVNPAENTQISALEQKIKDFIMQPLITKTEIRGEDGSLIDTEYRVTKGCEELFFLRLQNVYPVSSIDTSALYYTAFAQRIAEYLSNNMTYTLNPTLEGMVDGMSAVERFLFVTKEGYCVQYATAATLLLRSLGVPTRYVEGYIAPKFVRNRDENRVGNYICEVKDSNAHAWCEIYLPYYGWLTTEVTTPYYSDLYDPYETIDYTTSFRESSGESSVSETTEETEEEDDEETLWGVWGKTVCMCILSIAVLCVCIWLLRRFFTSRAEMRYQHETLLRDAKRQLIAENERGKAASALYDSMRRLIAVFGVNPMKGETPTAFAERLDKRFRLHNVETEDPSNDTAAVLSIIEKNEFGTAVLTGEELAVLAEYILRLEDAIKAEAGVLTMFRIRYIKGLL